MKYVKEFCKRGLMFGGFGPIVVGIVYLFLEMIVSDFTLNGNIVFVAIVSSYLLAFIQAGASIFNQIEEWSIMKTLCIHGLTLYLAYVGCYLLNNWIPFNISIVLIFSVIFVVTYLIIWGIVYLIIKNTSNQLNARIS